MNTRAAIQIRGIVQGVGFRPFIYNLAKRLNLKGYILNSSFGVSIEVEGPAPTVKEFLQEIQSDAPPLSQIESMDVQEDLPVSGFPDFVIKESISEAEKFVLISPDISICEECLAELFDPADRRYRYPFINCTNCGPRFTIIRDVPYDRPNTTMSGFKMCRECRTEYENPAHRRFHAQPNACPICGPRVYLLDAQGMPADYRQFSEIDAIAAVSHLLRNGNIVAIKGIGGFHLACDATNETVVARLRQRKFREEKPFALMAPDIETVAQYCRLNKTERDILQSPRRPIVLLRKRENTGIAPPVAPYQNHLGFMLPYSPLHYLLMNDFKKPLVLTSGNIADEPIAYQNEEAVQRLKQIGDYFLMHDRDIHMRCDDSVVREWNAQIYPIRRSRGFVPEPLRLKFDFKNQILACGAELKNTFCMTNQNFAFLSHHIGDLENLETLQSYKSGIEHFKKLFHLQPEVVAYDLHPDYLSTQYALDLPDNLLKIGIQHHHAHIASAMAEHGLSTEEPVIGIALDGTGYGTDGNLWGGEFLVTDYRNFERIWHLEYVPMPGGAQAIKEPWRMGLAYLYRAFGDKFIQLDIPFVKQLDPAKLPLLKQMMDKQIHSPLTSGMGRLFDAVAAVTGIRQTVKYEGQAAIELEMSTDESISQAYELALDPQNRIIQTAPLFNQIIRDLQERVLLAEIAAKFHNGIANTVLNIASEIRKKYALNRVVLSGGVFQNMLLLKKTNQFLKRENFQVYTHHKVPANDGGISLGQAVIAGFNR